ncbi:unnamed protein product [Prunus armeniaca]|uniref:GAG-pre-integrase domain-containing protein n=1 Tax=Prunus armeniaca TaxID=36596 RepID=A0A6J5WGX0_PRUAR|nr:unnamed protein product [Prunus armeniaca]
MKENKGSQRLNCTTHRANHASISIFNGSDTLKNFTANPTALINEFASYLQSKNGGAGSNHTTSIEDGNSSALLGKFAGFLADTEHIPQQDMQDSGATDHMTNHVSKFHKFEKLSKPSQVSIANGLCHQKTIGEGFYLDGLYYISKSSLRVFQAKSTSLQDSQLWHQRLAHPSQPILSTLFPNLGKDSIHVKPAICLRLLDYLLARLYPGLSHMVVPFKV